jgi:DNA-binding NtrC family response regulator
VNDELTLNADGPTLLSEEAAEISSALGQALESRSVLIVDDAHRSCEKLRELVQALGVRSQNISICQTLLLAKKRLDISPVDIVISDLHLKDGKGIELLQYGQFRRDDVESVFVLMTNDPVSDVMHESIRAGASTIIVKPITFNNLKDHLLYSLSKLSEKSKTREQNASDREMRAFFKRLSKHSPPKRSHE